MSTSLGKRLELEMRGRSADQILDLNLDNCRANKIEGLTSEFTNLQTLSLINLGLQSLENFPKLGNLRKLELSDNKIAGGLDCLTGCANITHLSLSGNKIKDFDVLDPLKDLPSLKSLDLFNCEVTNVPEYREKVFEKLEQLIYLDGFDREEKEQEDVDGEEDDDEDDDENEVDDDEDDDEDEDEVGLSYLTKNIDDDEEDEEDYDPDEVDDEDADDKIVEGEDEDDDDDDDDEDEDAVEDGEDDEDEEGEEEEDGEQSAARGTKRKHEEEEEGDEEEDA